MTKPLLDQFNFRLGEMALLLANELDESVEVTMIAVREQLEDELAIKGVAILLRAILKRKAEIERMTGGVSRY